MNDVMLWAQLALSLLGLLGLGLMLSTPRLIRAGFALFLTLLAVAGLLVLAHSALLALAEVIVYVGGILLLLLFGVMLTQRQHLAAHPLVLSNRLGAALAAGSLWGLLIYAFAGQWSGQVQPENTDPEPSLILSTALVGKFALAFEASGMLLLLALVGAAYLSRQAEEPD